MTDNKNLTIYLEPGFLESAAAGQHNFISQIVTRFTQLGYGVGFAPRGPDAAARAAADAGFSLFHLDPPPNARALSFRRAYVYPFWQIENTHLRQHFPVAKTRFSADLVPEMRAANKVAAWRARLFPGQSAQDEGFTLIALQGRLLERRRFQFCTPIEMIRHSLNYCDGPVVVALHPNEIYTPGERAELTKIAQSAPRVQISQTGARPLIARCRRIVTMNSAAAFEGFFFHKPAVLFAEIDFHHIAANVSREGPQAAFRPRPAPAYDAYLFWFLQRMSINAAAQNAGDKILNVMRRRGWDI